LPATTATSRSAAPGTSTAFQVAPLSVVRRSVPPENASPPTTAYSVAASAGSGTSRETASPSSPPSDHVTPPSVLRLTPPAAVPA
jgi:hypothetical protein